MDCIRRIPKSLFGEALLVHNYLSHKPPTFCLGTSGYADEEGLVYIDHSGDEQRRNPQHERQQEELDLNATANEAVGSSGPISRPFGGIGLDESHITQELRHCMQSMELEVRELRNENAKLRTTTRNLQLRGRTPLRHRSRSQSRSPPRRNHRPHTLSRRRRHHNSSDDSESSSEGDRDGSRRTYKLYKRTKGREVTPPIDGHTSFSSRILKVQPPRHFIKPTNMKYDRSIDPHIHLNDFEHRMIYDSAVDKVKCWAFPITLTGLASQWFTSLPAGLISSYSEIRELFLNEFTTSIDNTKHPINLLAVIERFNAEFKTIDGLLDVVASLCLTNGLANEEFKKQLTTKPVWTRKEMQVIAKELILREEVNRVVAATKNPQAHTAPRGHGQVSEKGVLPKARPLKGRAQNTKNRSLFCDYHQGYGHKTQDCYDLKYAIDQAIRDSKLNEFIQIIREPRTSDRERSPRPESRNPRSRKDQSRKSLSLPVPAPWKNLSRPLRRN
ncbi:hypothetical protein PIB30_073991 [Stylosanthes scabra]|uniref:Retrotransposon gag domain-containing protein n=1 Tax=Stylosanthes scabra TaxID=79078 RepID=A0ABU6US02_9FABA|nr:hypothetical protein [Stylosanthes scabra]